MPPRAPPTYDEDVLSVLVYEFSEAAVPASDAKIKRRLTRKKLGAWDPARVGTLRALKNALQDEIGRFDKSAFYTGSHGEYAELEDFDTDALSAAMIAQFPSIDADTIENIVPFCVYNYYLR